MTPKENGVPEMSTENRGPHGTVNNYVNKRCRCEDCTRAAREYQTGLKAKKAAVLAAEIKEHRSIHGSLCAGCGVLPEDYRVDRAEDGSIRGLLCHECKIMLGMLHYDVTRMRGLLRYMTPGTF